ncbi:MAG: 4-hydroxy-3-methylbut-2-enyl diphosphate reductase, partial [Lachnospiraceae bacterium]|nr:4-hydroxy-3-methylbut-2-enyl diphosphate reductase [Lachnospiraceae bacterium]
MEVIMAEHAGFCFGAKRAVDTIYEQIELGSRIYTYGPIVHNEEVVKDLERKGVEVIDTEQQLKEISEGTVMIRAHGVPRRIKETIERKGLKCVDATCPFVKRIHDIVEKESEAGKKIVIIGNAGHPEVVGIMDRSKEPATVIGTLEEAHEFICGTDEEICVVSQTTFNYNKFQDMVEIF